MKKNVFFYALTLCLIITACNTSKTGSTLYSPQDDVKKMGYHGAVKRVKIESFVPDTRAGEGLTLGKTSTLEFDKERRLTSSIGLANINKTYLYGDNGRVRESIELYRDIKMHTFHSYDNRGNCIKTVTYKVHNADSLLFEEREMTYDERDSITSCIILPKPKDMLQTAIFYNYGKDGCFAEKRIFSELVGKDMNFSGDPTTHLKIKFNDDRRPTEIEKFSLVEDIYTRQLEYNNHGHIVKEVFLRPDATPQEFTYYYTYGDKGNKAEAYTLEDGIKIEQMKYNDEGMPTVMEILNKDGHITDKYVYEYDEHGNMCSKTSLRLDPKKGILVEVHKEIKKIEYYE